MLPPSVFSSGNVVVAKRLYSTSNKPSKDSLSNNSNIEAAAFGSKARNNRISSSSLAKKVSLFLIRIVITLIGVILSKSLFLSWYNDTYSWQELKDNIFSLSSVLIGVGCLAGRFINYLLDYTIFNIKIKDLLLVNPTFNLKRLWNLLLSCRSSFFYDKLPLGVNKELSQKKNY